MLSSTSSTDCTSSLNCCKNGTNPTSGALLGRGAKTGAYNQSKLLDKNRIANRSHERKTCLSRVASRKQHLKKKHIVSHMFRLHKNSNLITGKCRPIINRSKARGLKLCLRYTFLRQINCQQNRRDFVCHVSTSVIPQRAQKRGAHTRKSHRYHSGAVKPQLSTATNRWLTR